MDEFPGNSDRSRRGPSRDGPEPQPETKNIERVVHGEVVRRKRPFSRRLKEAFIGGDAISVREYLLEDVVLPNFRDLIIDVVNGGVERLVLGESRASHRRMNGRVVGLPGRVDYRGFSQSPVRSLRDDPREPVSRRSRGAHNFEEIILESRPEAEMVLDGLFAILERYEQVAVSDLYELIGESANFTDFRYGWTDLRGSRIEHIRQGYLLNLPPPEPLER
jgi:hypothetical protein